MPNVNASYGRLTDLNALVPEFSLLYLFETLYLYQTFKNCLLT